MRNLSLCIVFIFGTFFSQSHPLHASALLFGEVSWFAAKTVRTWGVPIASVATGVSIGLTPHFFQEEHSTKTNSGKQRDMMIDVEDVDLSFGNKIIFDELNFDVRRGEKITLVGDNGVGKSTFLKMLSGERYDATGKIDVNGTVGYLPQHFESFDSNGPIQHIIKYSEKEEWQGLLDSCDVTDSDWYSEFTSRDGHSVFKLLDQLGVDPLTFKRPFSQLSGGEKSKVHLAALSYLNPDILLLDEPTNHLDFKGLKWLEGFLRYDQDTLVMASHDRALINATTTRISELSSNTHKFIDFSGGYQNYLSEQKKLAARAQQLRQRQDKEINSMRGNLGKIVQQNSGKRARKDAKDRNKIGFNARGGRNQKSKGHRVKQLKGKIEDLNHNLVEIPWKRKEMGIQLYDGENLAPLGLYIQNLGKSFGDKELFSDLNVHLSNKDRLVVTGGNGSGKTTFLKILDGSLDPDVGSISSQGIKFGFLDQEQETLDLSLSPFELLFDHLEGNKSKENVIKALSQFGVDIKHDLHTPLSNLSIGSRRKTQLAKIVFEGANVLLLDEPTNHIDFPSIEMIEEELKQFPGIVISVSHDRYHIKKIATKQIHLGK